MQKSGISKGERQRRHQQSSLAIQQGLPRLERRWVTGPTLRKTLNISPVTLWRWRRAGGFPTAKRINGRLYFAWHEVAAWFDKQQDAA